MQDQTHENLLRLMPLESDGLESHMVPTHIALGGNWNDPDSWAGGVVPDEGAIVHIPMGVTITASDNVSSGAHIFMVRVDGTLNVTAPNGTVTSLEVDTLFSTNQGTLRVDADDASDGAVDIAISPYDLVNGSKAGWAQGAIDYYRDGDAVTGWDGIADIDDGAGVLGRYSWDSEQLSLGIVGHGAAEIRGQSKQEQIDHAGLAQGASEMVITEHSLSDLNWSVGDRLLITGTEYSGTSLGVDTGLLTSDLNSDRVNTLETLNTQDEVVRIKSITQGGDGDVIVAFGDPAAFNENSPSASADYQLEHSHIPRQFTLEGTETNFLSVGNLSRNVTIRSDVATESANSEIQGANSIENSLALSSSNYGKVGISGRLTDGTHDVTERGHIMFMHNDDVTIESIAVRAMGRTDKTAALDSLDNPSNSATDKDGLLYNTAAGDSGSALANEIANQVGRYGLHLHKNGVSETDASLGAWIEGSVVEGSPGWGFAQHDSMAVFANNIAYDIVGSGFMAETGNEAGVWYNNLSVGVQGFSKSEDVFQQSFSNDLGRTGSGYWLEGRAIALIDNNAVSTETAYAWHNEGTNQINTPSFVLSLYDDYFSWVNTELGLTGDDALRVRDGEALWMKMALRYWMILLEQVFQRLKPTLTVQMMSYKMG